MNIKRKRRCDSEKMHYICAHNFVSFSFNAINKTVKAIKDHKLMSERQIVINGLRVVGTLFCVLCNVVLLLIASSHFVNNKEITYKRAAHTIVAELNKTTTYADKDAKSH